MKKKESKKMDNFEIFTFGFSTLRKVSGMYGMDLHVAIE